MGSSRLCVKNLPKYVAEDRLRDFFSQKGEVTDAKLMHTKDGKSRQFAFIGFRTEQEAEEAIDYFNNSYLDTFRITCEVARKVGDSNIPRPWSRYSIKKDDQVNEKDKEKVGVGAGGSTLLNSKGPGTANDATKSSKSDVNGDPKLQEFLQVMQPRAKSKLWANDMLGPSQPADKNSEAEVKGGRLCKGSKKQSAQIPAEMAEGSDKENEMNLGKLSIVALNGASDTSKEKKSCERAKDEFISDMDYFKSRVKQNWSDSESDNEVSTGDEVAPEKDAQESLTPAGDEQVETRKEVSLGDPDGAKIDDDNKSSAHNDENERALDTGRLFVRNLPYTTDEDELLELFSKFGDVSQVHLVVDKDTKRSKGIGYILYALPESAVRALEELDNSIFQGRLLHVMPAKPQNPTERQGTTLPSGQAAKSFKQKRKEQRKTSEISGDTRAWNSLFIRQDTVVENIARKYGVSKSDVLDREADDLPVRVALGETHAIAETKKALTSAGVNIVALEEFASRKSNNIQRSNHVILVKNLPYGSSEGDLTKMFENFGSLDKIILPPTKALALVIFLEAVEARAAFRGLAYKRYKDAPLYLEWAPENIMSLNPTSKTNEQKNAIGKLEIKRVLLEQSVEPVPEVDIDPDRVESRSVFVKNLNFKTSDDCLKKHFSDNIKKGRILSVKVKKHLKNGKNMSMGYGFIEFDSVDAAIDGCRDLQGTILDGHALILQLCHAKKDDQVQKKVKKDKSATKLIVRNVAFEATEKDLRQLFSPFGQIRSLRLPMKFDSHRGFAFVEYVTKQEAQNALQALSSTHLYGRHLVLERAKEGEGLEELRARTAAQFAEDSNGLQKLSKKRKHMTIVDEDKVKFERLMD